MNKVHTGGVVILFNYIDVSVASPMVPRDCPVSCRRSAEKSPRVLAERTDIDITPVGGITVDRSLVSEESHSILVASAIDPSSETTTTRLWYGIDIG